MEFGYTANQIIDEGRVTKEDVKLIKTWSRTQELPKLKDEQVVFFLLSCNNDHEATKRTIKVHFLLKKNFPEIINNRNVERKELQKQLEVIDFCVLPEKTDDGCAIIFARLNDTYYRNFEFGPAIKIFNMMLDSVVFDYPPEGLVILFDMTGIGLMHLTRVRVRLISLCFRYLQEGFPMKLKEIHVLNTVYFIDKVMTIIKPFISMKVLDVVNFHRPDMDMNKFYEKCIPKRCMPEDYGGDLPSVRVLHDWNTQKLILLQPLFDAEELQRASGD